MRMVSYYYNRGKNKEVCMKTTIIDATNGHISLSQYDLIGYLKKHNRILPGIAKIRISHCLAPISTLIGSKFTTKYVVTEEAERAYNEKAIYY